MKRNPFEEVKPHIQKDLPFSSKTEKRLTKEKMREIREMQKLKGKEAVKRRREELIMASKKKAKEGQEVLRRVGRLKYVDKDGSNEFNNLTEQKTDKVEKIKPLKISVSREIADDRFSESEADLELYFNGENGFFINNKSVSVEEFLNSLGRGSFQLYNKRPELKEIFNGKLKKERYYNKLRRKTKNEFDKIKNEEMQQTLNKE